MSQDNYIKKQTKCKKTKKYKQLSESERIKIKQLYDEKLSYNQISMRISRSRSTIMREIKRNGKLNQTSLTAIRKNQKKYAYYHKKAQLAQDIRFVRPKSIKKFSFFIKYANDNITSQTSLEDLYFNFKKFHQEKDCSCLKSIYNFAHKHIIEFTWGGKVFKSNDKRHLKILL